MILPRQNLNLPERPNVVMPKKLVTLREAELYAILNAFELYPKEGIRGIAQLLGIPRSTLYDKLVQLGIHKANRSSRGKKFREAA